jgi:hypothetical protein
VDLFQDADKNELARGLVRLAWHATSIQWCGIATFFLCATFLELSGGLILAIRILSLTFLATTVLALITVPKRAWLFGAIFVCGWVGTW